MTIDAHIIAWNESEIIRLTVQYYKSFCRRVVIYDNYSDDDTREIATAAGAEVKLFGIQGVLDDKEYLKVKNHCWKGSDADYVIVCDTDEILWHPKGVINIFKSEWGATIFNTTGWGIFSNVMPVNDITELMDVVPDSNYSKNIVFSPKLREIDYVYGCHVARPQGEIKYAVRGFHILHYRCIGGIDRLITKHRVYKERLSDINKKWNLGHHYSEPEEDKRRYFEENLKKSKPIELWITKEYARCVE